MRGGTSEPRTGRARSGRPGGGGHGAQPLPIPPPLPAAPSRSYLPPSLRSPSSTRRGGAGRAAGLLREQPWLGRPSSAPRSHFPSRGRTSREGRRDGTGWDGTGRPAQVTRAGRRSGRPRHLGSTASGRRAGQRWEHPTSPSLGSPRCPPSVVTPLSPPLPPALSAQSHFTGSIRLEKIIEFPSAGAVGPSPNPRFGRARRVPSHGALARS